MEQELKDESKCVALGVVVLPGGGYDFFIYPTLNRSPVKAFHDAVEGERSKGDASSVHHRMVIMQVLRRHFEPSPNSYFPQFRKRYREGVPVMFQLFLQGPNGQPHQISSLLPMILFGLKIKERNQLTRKDPEYDLLRLFSDK